MYSEKFLYRNKKGDTGLCHWELLAGELHAAKSVFCFCVREKSRLILNQLYYFKQEGETKPSQWKNSLLLKRIYVKQQVSIQNFTGHWQFSRQNQLFCFERIYQLMSGCEYKTDINLNISILPTFHSSLNVFKNKKALL